jgi:L-serine/L-threonine ammonia-lyase
VKFADDHKIMVPPACGASLAAVYGDTLQQLQQEETLPQEMNNIVVIVCGGSGVNLDSLQKWRTQYNLDSD